MAASTYSHAMPPPLPPEVFGLDPEGRKARMQRIAAAILAEWSATARGQLKSTLAAYLKSLAIREATENRVVVALPGDDHDVGKAAQLARMVEFGMGPGGIGTSGPYDVRQYLLRASTRHIRWGKSGPYVDVPFGHKAADIAKAGGPALRRQARALSPTMTDHRNNRTIWGGRLPAGTVAKLAAHHATDPFAGMVRRVSTYSKAGKAQTSGYMTWRRASLNASSPKAWISRGIKAHHLAMLVNAQVPRLINEVS